MFLSENRQHPFSSWLGQNLILLSFGEARFMIPVNLISLKFQGFMSNGSNKNRETKLSLESNTLRRNNYQTLLLTKHFIIKGLANRRLLIESITAK